jgi:hypothetical protein
MQLFMDIHKHVSGLTKKTVEDANAADVTTQDERNATYMPHWFNDMTGDVFSLFHPPSEEAATQVHREAQGLVADDIIEVQEGR